MKHIRFFRQMFFWLFIAGFISGSWAIGADDDTAKRHASGAADSTLQAPFAEHLVYDISFLWFNRFGEAALSFAPGEAPGLWQAELEARTLGVAAWITRDRLQRYISKMDLDKRKNFRSLIHESDIRKTKDGERKIRLKRYLFDYDLGQIVQQVIRNGQRRPDEMISMPVSTPNDVLTAFYNFRRGVFGELRPGGHYRIPTLEKDKASEIIVDIFADEKRPSDLGFPAGGLLARVQLDPEVLDTGDGILYIWFDEQQRPALILIQNVIGLGDVRCTLREVEKQS